VTTGASENDRVSRRSLIKIPAKRFPQLCELILRSSVPGNPFTRPKLFCLPCDLCFEFGQIIETGQVDSPFWIATDVGMRIDEARNDKLSANVDRKIRSVLVPQPIPSDGDDMTIAHCHRRVTREQDIGGEDLSVVQDEINQLLPEDLSDNHTAEQQHEKDFLQEQDAVYYMTSITTAYVQLASACIINQMGAAT